MCECVCIWSFVFFHDDKELLSQKVLLCMHNVHHTWIYGVSPIFNTCYIAHSIDILPLVGCLLLFPLSSLLVEYQVECVPLSSTRFNEPGNPQFKNTNVMMRYFFIYIHIPHVYYTILYKCLMFSHFYF